MKRFITYIKTLVLAVAVLSAPVASAQKVTVKADIDSAVMVMGDLNKIHVTVDIPQQYTSTAELVDFPIIPPGISYLQSTGFDFVKTDSTVTTTADGQKIDFEFTIQGFDPSLVILNPFAVVPAPGADTAFSNVVSFKILPVDVDSLETINPMASVVAPAFEWSDFFPDWLLWTLLCLSVAALVVLFCVDLRKRKQEAEIRRTPPIPPYELAISRLSHLRTAGLAESGNEKEYYTELVDILRQYLQGRFGINAMEMTSSQIVKALRSNPATRMTADQMRSVLSIADFVKFAKVRPLPDDNNRAFARAQDFVEQTKPEPEPETPEDAQPSKDPQPSKTR